MLAPVTYYNQLPESQLYPILRNIAYGQSMNDYAELIGNMNISHFYRRRMKFYDNGPNFHLNNTNPLLPITLRFGLQINFAMGRRRDLNFHGYITESCITSLNTSGTLLAIDAPVRSHQDARIKSQFIKGAKLKIEYSTTNHFADIKLEWPGQSTPFSCPINASAQYANATFGVAPFYGWNYF